MSKTVLEENLRKIALKTLEIQFKTFDLYYYIEGDTQVTRGKIQDLNILIKELDHLREELP